MTPKKEDVSTKRMVASKKTIDARILEIIKTGILKKTQGFQKLLAQICEEFPCNRPNKKHFTNRVKNIIWNTAEIDKALQEIIRNDLPIAKFKSIFPFVPDCAITERAKWHRGESGSKKHTSEFLRGLGRIGIIDSNIELPHSSFKKPFVIPVPNEENWTIMFLNGANIGTRYPKDIVGNVVRRALSDADERRDPALILTNLMWLDLKQAASSAKVARSHVLGDSANPNLIKDAGYRTKAKAIIKNKPIGEVAYLTAEERFDDILGGWMKIFTKPDGRYEYNGPVYIVLGNNEEELISAIASWEVRYLTITKASKLRKELKFTNMALRKAEKEQDNDRIDTLEKEADSIRNELSRTIISNVTTHEWQRFYNIALTTVVHKLQSTIPNSTVIGKGTSNISVGGKNIAIEIPSHRNVTDTLLQNSAKNCGPKILREQYPDSVVVCHPWSLRFQMTAREVDKDGKRESAKIFVAPIAIDGDYIRSKLDSTNVKHPLAKVVFNETFYPGVLRLRSSNGILDADFISSKALESFKQYPIPRNFKKKGSLVYTQGPKYIWTMFGSDPHWGSRAKAFVTNQKSGMRLGMTEAVFEMMREAGLCRSNNMRVHFFGVPDDPTQGQNFPARTQQHPHQMPMDQIEKIALRLLVNNSSKEMCDFLLYQLEKRGSDYPLEQMIQMMDRHITSNVDIFNAILKRSQRAKIIIRSIGEIANTRFYGFDTRNLGIINFGAGNHLAHTVDGEIVESPLYAQKLRDILLVYPQWKKQPDLLKKLVASPLYSGETIGWGIISVEGCHEYGVDMRSTPTKMAGWGDTLLGWVRNDIQRGNYSRIFEGKLPVLKVAGDKHFFCACATETAFYHMAAAGVETDRYGERGFPPNNTGVSFVGLPVDGPNSGPILVRTLPFDVIKNFVEDNPRPFNWEEFLPKPA